MSEPIETKNAAKFDEHGNMILMISKDELNSAKFGLYHYPVLIYNEHLKSFVTKEFLSGQESNAFAKHTVLFLNRQIEDLVVVVREFSRTVIDLLKPKGDIMKSGWFWIIVMVIIGIMGVAFLPKILESMSGSASAAGGAVNAAAGAISGNPITPNG
jgi:hypothetical protein